MNQPALFVSHESSLQSGGGGVQRCTREYAATLTAAGFVLTMLPYTGTRTWTARLRRKFRPRPYANLVPPEFAAECAARAAAIGAKWIFLNHCDTAPLAEEIERLAPGRYRFATLSHGLDSTDFLHEVRMGYAPPGRGAAWLGQQLVAEMQHRAHLHVVFCLSEVPDLTIERWLGAKHACVLPRTLSERPLAQRPTRGRVGTVSTLNHPPNLEGIALLAGALATHPGVRLRVVGGPAPDGTRLAARFDNIDYLGALDDAGLEAEAATWCAFTNPIFCYPRGASTKLAVPLAWGMPIATTRAGARGYAWDEAVIPLCDTPEQLGLRCAELASLNSHAQEQRAAQALAARSPSLSDVAALVRATLAKVI